MATEYDHSGMEQDARLPLILDPEELETHLGERDLLVVDLSRPETYSQLHVPGAVHLSYTELVTKQGPARGMLPSDEHLSKLFSGLGLTPDTHVVAYDDEGGGKAGRLLWTLDMVGHRRFSLLNGGLHAWANEGHPLSREPAQREPTQYQGISGLLVGLGQPPGYSNRDRRWSARGVGPPSGGQEASMRYGSHPCLLVSAIPQF